MTTEMRSRAEVLDYFSKDDFLMTAQLMRASMSNDEYRGFRSTLGNLHSFFANAGTVDVLVRSSDEELMEYSGIGESTVAAVNLVLVAMLGE